MGSGRTHRHKLIYPKVQPLFELGTVNIDDEDAGIRSPKVNPIEGIVVFLACCVPDLDCAIIDLLQFAVNMLGLLSHGAERIMHVSYQQ